MLLGAIRGASALEQTSHLEYGRRVMLGPEPRVMALRETHSQELGLNLLTDGESPAPPDLGMEVTPQRGTMNRLALWGAGFHPPPPTPTQTSVGVTQTRENHRHKRCQEHGVGDTVLFS